MPQCNFCSKTADNVPGGILTKGILGSYICIACVHAILALTISQQIQRIKVLEKGYKETNLERLRKTIEDLERWKELAGEEVSDVPDPRP